MHDATNLRQHRIAHCMTVGIVDPLEMIEVHQRESEGRLLRGPELAVEHVEKRSAVGESGERISACFARGLQFVELAFGHIAYGHNEARGLASRRFDGPQLRFQPAGLSVVFDRSFEDLGLTGLFGSFLERGGHHFTIECAEERRHMQALHVIAPTQPPRGGRGKADRSSAVQLQKRVVRMVGDKALHRLAIDQFVHYALALLDGNGHRECDQQQDDHIKLQEQGLLPQRYREFGEGARFAGKSSCRSSGYDQHRDGRSEAPEAETGENKRYDREEKGRQKRLGKSDYRNESGERKDRDKRQHAAPVAYVAIIRLRIGFEQQRQRQNEQRPKSVTDQP